MNHFSKEVTQPPLLGIVLYILSIIFLPVFLMLDRPYYLFALICMIIIHHGSHEAIHGTLASRKRDGKYTPIVLGILGMAALGHNFIFLRWSHLAHHRYGRLEEQHTIDGQAKRIRNGKVWYYSSLLGASYIYHEIAGYLYPLLGDRYHILSRRFKKEYYRNATYIFAQIVAFNVTVGLLFIGGIKLIICKLLFMLYWGAFQNVAHHGIEIGKHHEHSRVASRTYRLPSWIEFFIYRAGPYHLEHHLFPYIPGPNLSSNDVQNEVNRKLGFNPPKLDGKQYLKDTFVQYRGLKHVTSEIRNWRQYQV